MFDGGDHQEARELLRRLLKQAGWEIRDLVLALGGAGHTVEEQQIRDWGRPILKSGKVRRFPDDWGLLLSIARMLLAQPKEYRPLPAEVVRFLLLLDLPHDEVNSLLHDLWPLELRREVRRELIRAQSALWEGLEYGTDEEELSNAQRQLRQLPLDRVPRPGNLPPLSSIRLQQNPLFVGRERELVELARQLREPGRAVALTAAGGWGKTQLAVEFAYRYGQYFKGGVFWMSFAEPALVRSQVIASGTRLSADFVRLDPADQERVVRDYWADPLPKLLIFDNCEDERLFQEWRPTGTSSRVLITSRYAGWNPVLGVQVLRLGLLPLDQSVTLLRLFRPDLSADDQVLAAIAERLGQVPLALHLAGSFLHLNGLSYRPAHYLADLEAGTLVEHPSLRGDDLPVSPTDHDQDLARSFGLSYRLLLTGEQSAALSRALLERAACFAPGAPIPLDLLTATVAPPAGSYALPRAVNYLVSLSLLSGGASDVALHPLIADYVLATATDNEAQSAVEAALLDQAGQASDSQDLAALRMLEPHLQLVAATSLKRADARTARLHFELGRLLHLLGEYVAAAAAYEHAGQLDIVLEGPHYPALVRTRRALATLRIEQGRYAEARTLLAGVLADDEQRHGPDAEIVAWDLNLLAEAWREEQAFAEARPLYEHALAIQQSSAGRNPAWTAMIRNNLAALLHQQGELAAAEAIYAEVLPVYIAEFGEQSNEVLKVRRNIGELLADSGRYAEAAVLFTELLPLSEQVCGKTHPDTAGILFLLGRCKIALGELWSARPLLLRALSIGEAVLGSAHPHTLRIHQALDALQDE